MLKDPKLIEESLERVKDKLISVEDALAMVKSGDQIVVGLACSEGKLFCRNLHTIADRVKDVTVNNCLPMENYEFFMNPEYRHSFNLAGWFYAPGIRKAHKYGACSFIPNNLHFAGDKRFDHIHINMFVGLASMPDEHGYVSLSLGNTYEKLAAEKADIVILEINPKAPRCFGDVQVHISDVDHFIFADYDIPTIPDADPNEKDKTIASYIIPFVKDGSCIQLGIGGIPNAVATQLYDKKNLGVHTEMLTSEMGKLAKAGVINGKCKTLNKGQIAATFAMGTQELYDFIDNNPGVVFTRGSWTNDPYVIGQNDNQISINTTLEVDVTGQCCSESIGSMQFSGSGGQSDTVIGAQNSKGGHSIIALYSTAMVKNPATGEREEISKIVVQLKPGATVSTSRNDVEYLCTEYGIVNLKGTTLAERVEKIISIAHPKFRDQLWADAYAAGIVCKKD